MEIQNTESRTLNAGMIQDVQIKFQPEGSYRFALNAVLQSNEGELGSIISEQSNAECGALPSGFMPIGRCLTNKSQIVIFAASDTESYIGYFDPTSCTMTEIVRTTCLGFNSNYPMETMFRTVRECEDTIYFTDGINPYRSINLSNLDKYKDQDGNWVCSKFDFSPDLIMPKIDSATVFDTGGQLKIGSYQFAIRYVDSLSNVTNWFYVTRPVTIYDEPQVNEYHLIDGGYNVVQSLEESGSVPISSKSIQLDINSLDPQFQYFQLAVLMSTSGSGVVSEVYILPKVSITNTNQSFLFASYSPETGAIQTVIDEINVDTINVHIAKTHTQTDSRHILGNLEFKSYKYAEFQRAANDITVKFVTDDVPALDQTVLGNPKHPLSTFKKQGLMGDEIVALSVQYLNTKGEWSPSFHIPGRTLLPHDTVAIPDSRETRFLPDALTHPAWMVSSTALIDGTLGYYQTSTDYPDTLCDGERIFPTGKIRHHRIPDRKLIPHYKPDPSYTTTPNASTTVEPGVITLIGLEFDNVVYPSDDIVGHRFLVSRRTESTKTVLDYGLLNLNLQIQSTTPIDTYSYKGYFGGAANLVRSNLAGFINPRSLYLKDVTNGSYFSISGIYPWFPDTGSIRYHRNNERLMCPARNIDLTVWADLGQRGYFATGTSPYYTPTNWVYSASAVIPPKSYKTNFGPDSARLFNDTFSNYLYAYAFDTPFIPSPLSISNSRLGLYYAANKRYITPYSDLASIEYEVLHNSYLTTTQSGPIYGGDSFICDLTYFEVLITKLEGSNKLITSNNLSWFFIESDINFSLSHSGSSSCEQELRWNPLFTDGAPLFNYLIDRVFTLDSEGNCFLEREPVCRQFYDYNKDFSKRTYEKVVGQLAVNETNYCENCNNKYPYRIIASEKAFQTQQTDARQTFKANNFTDTLGVDGPITRLLLDKDQLYAVTHRSIYFVPVRPQSIQTNEANIYVGTGEIFSIPPKKLTTMDYSYGGSTHQWSFIQTPFGSVWVDELSSNIFMLSDSLKELSAIGMDSFFENNLTINLNAAISAIQGTKYQYQSPTHTLGIGFIGVYDPRYARILLHKRDYIPLKPLKKFGEDTSIDYIYYQDSKFYAYTFPGSDPLEITVNSPNYFGKASYTVSFSLQSNAWVSFHSYLPNYMFNNEDTFFSSTSHKIWAHNKNTYLDFYNTDYDFVIDTIFTTPAAIAKVWDSVLLTMGVHRYNAFTKSFIDVNDRTFYKGMFYSDRQSSSLQDIEIKDTAFMNNIRIDEQTIAAQRVDGRWQLSEIRNYARSDQPIFDSSWSGIQSSYFIDKVPNISGVDLNTSMFNSARIKGEYLGARLYYKADKTDKLVLDLINITNRISIR